MAGQPQNLNICDTIDHERDPLELENLWDHPEYRSLQLDLLWALHQSMLDAAIETPRPTHQA